MYFRTCFQFANTYIVLAITKQDINAFTSAKNLNNSIIQSFSIEPSIASPHNALSTVRQYYIRFKGSYY